MADQPTNPSIFSPSDPAHPSQPNSDHTTTSGKKPSTILSAVTSSSFLPTLTSAPITTRILSHSILLILVCGGVVGAYLYGFDLFQVQVAHQSQLPIQVQVVDWTNLELAVFLGGISALITAALVWTGTANIDFYALVGEFWWLSLPAVAAAGTALVLMMETSTSIKEVE